MKIALQVSVNLGVVLLLASCGSDSVPKAPTTSVTNEEAAGDALPDAEESMDEIVIPPQEYYDALLEDQMASLSLAGENSDAQVLFLDFDGATLTKGYRRGQSFILCRSTATLPDSGYGPADREDIALMVQDYYNAANALVKVTIDEPAAGSFTTIIVGGEYSDLGCRGRGVLGIAPLDNGNSNANDIGFAFVNGGNNGLKTAAVTIAHEAGHSFGLDHIQTGDAIMYPSVRQNIEAFKEGKIVGRIARQDSPAVLRNVLGEGSYDGDLGSGNGTPDTDPESDTGNGDGDDDGDDGGVFNPSPDPDNNNSSPSPFPGGIIPGIDQLKGIADLLATLDPSQKIDISQLLPQIGSVLPGGLNNIPNIGGIDGIDSILTVILMASQAGQNQGGGGLSGGPLTDFLQTFLDPNNLQQSGIGSAADLGALIATTGGGSPEIAAILIVLQALMNSQASNDPGTTPAGPDLSQLPDLSGLLGLNNASSLGDLFGILGGQAGFVRSNYNGATQNALLSLLKVAHGQAYFSAKQSLIGSTSNDN